MNALQFWALKIIDKTSANHLKILWSSNLFQHKFTRSIQKGAQHIDTRERIPALETFKKMIRERFPFDHAIWPRST